MSSWKGGADDSECERRPVERWVGCGADSFGAAQEPEPIYNSRSGSRGISELVSLSVTWQAAT
jgi:hypothetical protein